MATSAEMAVAIIVGRAFESLGLRYLIGGSLASSLHGLPRSSFDADLLAELPLARVSEIVALLHPRFYADVEMIRDAVRRRTSFNVIDYDTGYKVDVFVLGADPLAQEEMRRRLPRDVGDVSGPVFFATAEDMVLQKLAWYRIGGETSERQWTDVMGMLKVQGGGIDLEYLRRWAAHANVTDLLERALRDAAS